MSKVPAQTRKQTAWTGVPETRRAIMRANRRRDTGPELALRSALHGAGARYRVDFPIRPAGKRPVRPDIVFTARRIAVFVDGCFWHGCPLHHTKPIANAQYWEDKVSSNRDRDRRTTSTLEADGWTVIRIWEHENPQTAAAQILAVVNTVAPQR